ncbi:MAG: phospho-N-acetylmuramoyl-pentapeptide-transferase [Clostridia bacterium]|nr:phospho-N-acetylmuramoyl-pentapeptide-transferase [Clostridia bacterium]
MIKIIVGFILSFLISLLLLPFIIKLIRKLSCSQTILKYVEEHKSKQGTPTMGGVVFFISTLVAVVCLMDYSTELAMCVGVGLAFAIVGLMDDYIKVKLKQNMGLAPYQKIIGQVGIAIIFACYIYFFSPNKGVIYLPFTFKAIDLGVWIIPLVIVVCLATTNSVNLTDGLDGLAGGVSVVYSGVFVALISIFASIAFNAGEADAFVNLYNNTAVLLAILMGSIMAFLIFNTNKASIFMGDVGALGIGGMFASTACILGFELMLAIVGVMFVITTLSDIVQVIYFKRTGGKRILKMAPLHHHFQMCGHSEAKIGYIYQVITLIIGLITILLTLCFA